MSGVADRFTALSPERRALVKRLLARDAISDAPHAGRAPRTPVETALCAIWREVLGVDVSIDDDYFECGGDSILAVSILAKAREVGALFTADQLFRTPTIASLSAHIAAVPVSEEAAEPLEAESAADEFPLTPLQHGLLAESLRSSEPGVNVSQLCCRVSGALDVSLFQACWDDAIARYAVLRGHIVSDEQGTPRQRIAPAARVPLATQDWTAWDPSRQARALDALLESDRRQAFDLSTPPLMRLMLVRTAADVHHCVWTHHHLLLDGWSHHLLLEHVFETYAARRSGRAPRHRRPQSFHRYVDWLASQQSESDEKFWRGYLDRASAGRGAALAATTIPEKSCRAAHACVVDEAATKALNAAARRHRMSLSTLLHAAWALCDAAARGHDDVVVGTTVTIRPAELAGSNRLVGLCTNTVPMRVRCATGAAVGAWLESLHTSHVEWRRHTHAPLPSIARWTGTDSGPLFETLVVIQNLPGIFVDPPASCDLTLDQIRFAVREAYPLVVVFTPGSSMRVDLKYDPARHTAAHVESTARLLARALQIVAAETSVSVSGAIGTLRSEKQATADTEARAKREADVRQLRGGIARRASDRGALTVSDADLVSIAPPRGLSWPAAIVPRRAGVDLVAWLRGNLARVEQLRLRDGAVLFRGFPQHDGLEPQAHLEAVMCAVAGELMPYVERSSPRREVGRRVYTSTEHPADQRIPLHNENSYAHTWPQQLAFACVRASQEGGQTPLADCRHVLRLLPHDIVNRFRAKHVLYIRNYRDGVGLPWQTVFGTTDRAEAEARCRSHGYEVRWKSDGGLRTRRIAPALATHPRTGEEIWFNHVAFFHVTSMEPSMRDALLAQYEEDELPFQTRYGDGTAIEPEALEAIRGAYAKATVQFDWREGDVLLVDNMLVAHGRAPFHGPRRILVAMADPLGAAGRRL